MILAAAAVLIVGAILLFGGSDAAPTAARNIVEQRHPGSLFEGFRLGCDHFPRRESSQVQVPEKLGSL